MFIKNKRRLGSINDPNLSILCFFLMELIPRIFFLSKSKFPMRMVWPSFTFKKSCSIMFDQRGWAYNTNFLSLFWIAQQKLSRAVVCLALMHFLDSIRLGIPNSKKSSIVMSMAFPDLLTQDVKSSESHTFPILHFPHCIF